MGPSPASFPMNTANSLPLPRPGRMPGTRERRYSSDTRVAMNSFRHGSVQLLFVIAVAAIFVDDVAQSQYSGLRLLTNAKEKGAVCIDGSAPGYYFSPGFGGGVQNWMIYVEGGGWCRSINECANRANTYLGSTNHSPPREILPNTGILSHNAGVNPDFYNWNIAWIRYCDGSSFVGDRDEPVVVSKNLTIYLRGQRVWDAIMEDLMDIGMAKAEKALLIGCSAGGLTAILHCDSFKALFPGNSVVKCMADAGFFLDTPDVSGGLTSLELFRGVALTHNVMPALDKRCTSSRPASSAWDCFFAQNALPYVNTPLYILQSDLDIYQIGNLVAPKSADPTGTWTRCTQDLGSCSSKQLGVLEEFRIRMVRALEAADSAVRGEFVISCYAHCMATDTARWNGHQTFLINGKTIAQSVGDWYNARNVNDFVLVDGPYPSNPTCSGRTTHSEETDFAEHLVVTQD
ncbi:hypothetical protein Mp_3g22170 [Marchantia polymorpha subsp. ruderalis]|nr:hypothetical protein MARPO_0272s0001 [Marchantia polymorpha]BBN06557.1 hypothetical protein Mp_3g22170 [Marchantia polymorpha subsp. ruderalis]|eukprot:PTQ26910.1 hypothetical protein MARPO_0272s0001 [Marchantia polymorpha]